MVRLYGNSAPKIKVWFQAGLHGNESASTEGMLYLIHPDFRKINKDFG
ncbi:MAG: hypothetical protein CM15mP59_0250 [Flavobacteriaceae bacterium]|nr:MAG: hypothetical protein CM15mP59_0250 [Flavobacteriaceae bacterium]